MRFNFTSVARVASPAFVALALAPQAHAAVQVDSNASVPTLVGTLVAGETYSITAGGISDLYVAFNHGTGLTFTADGKPTYAFPAPYATFYPNGLDYDPVAGPTHYGLGGPGKPLGSLLGTFTATPTASDYFTIGLGTTITAPATGPLYAVVNDTFYGDNSVTGFSVSLAPVPEPQVYALMLAGLSAIGWVARRRKAA